MFLRRFTVTSLSLRRCFSNNSTSNLTSVIAELNKEMDSVFGTPPSRGNINPINNLSMAQEPQFNSPETGLTHINSTGDAQMVDVSLKETTNRIAIASCKVILGKEVFNLVSENQIAKGDVLSVARIAGIIGAKQTSNLIPLCHNICLNHVSIDLSLNEKDFSVEIKGEAASTGKTGVEMEAMVGVSIAGLTVYDMCKAASKEIQIMNVRLERKSGGKSGEWSRKQ